MKHRYALATLTAIMATPAAAQQLMPGGVLPPQDVEAIVRSAGLDPLGPPMRRGIHYVLPAIGDADRQMTVLVDARTGGILSITPVATASRLPPRGVAPGPYERGYQGPPPAGYRGESPAPYQGPPGAYRMGPPPGDEDDAPVVYAPRPPGAIPDAPSVARGGPPPVVRGGPPTVIRAMPPEDDVANAEPDVMARPGRPGALPPPPERFPQRAPPVTAAKPKPEKKAAAAVSKQAPLPKPRPATPSSGEPAKTDGNAAAPPPAPERKPDSSAALPN